MHPCVISLADRLASRAVEERHDARALVDDAEQRVAAFLLGCAVAGTACRRFGSSESLEWAGNAWPCWAP
eukprot:3560603-Pleurochrysis_carterae.AAC.1